MLSALGFIGGFFEAKGLVPAGSTLNGVPSGTLPISLGGATGPTYDGLVRSLDSLVNGSDSRLPIIPVIVAVAYVAIAVCHIIEAVQAAGG